MCSLNHYQKKKKKPQPILKTSHWSIFVLHINFVVGDGEFCGGGVGGRMALKVQNQRGKTMWIFANSGDLKKRIDVGLIMSKEKVPFF